mmetsp:Transcript_1744/g.2129  ORF Transcript_1744/g.2129 Transcript_1744/m.2129 type:complete len:118 (+) Transcript_1744:246-599(+)
MQHLKMNEAVFAEGKDITYDSFFSQVTLQLCSRDTTLGKFEFPKAAFCRFAVRKEDIPSETVKILMDRILFDCSANLTCKQPVESFKIMILPPLFCKEIKNSYWAKPPLLREIATPS